MCMVCKYVCAPHVFATHSEGRRGRQIPLELELIDGVGPWNGNRVLLRATCAPEPSFQPLKKFKVMFTCVEEDTHSTGGDQKFSHYLGAASNSGGQALPPKPSHRLYNGSFV